MASGVREIGEEAVWTISTAKPGNGVDKLRDGDIESYWQSDAQQPHWICVNFHRKQRVQKVALYLDYSLDESYTPKRIAIRAGNSTSSIQDIKEISLEKPSGWIDISLCPEEEEGKYSSISVRMVQICILSMHQNGRDTHIRQVRIYGPRTEQFNLETPLFETVEMSQFAALR